MHHMFLRLKEVRAECPLSEDRSEMPCDVEKDNTGEAFLLDRLQVLAVTKQLRRHILHLPERRRE